MTWNCRFVWPRIVNIGCHALVPLNSLGMYPRVSDMETPQIDDRLCNNCDGYVRTMYKASRIGENLPENRNMPVTANAYCKYVRVSSGDVRVDQYRDLPMINRWLVITGWIVARSSRNAVKISCLGNRRGFQPRRNFHSRQLLSLVADRCNLARCRRNYNWKNPGSNVLH